MMPGRPDAFQDHKLFIVNLNPTTDMHLPGAKENIIHNQYFLEVLVKKAHRCIYLKVV